MNRRQFLIAAACTVSGSLSANAAERFAYEAKRFEAERYTGKPILVHITAPWCGECRAQKPVVAALSDQPEYQSLIIFDVDFDTQKDALTALRVQKQSTIVMFKDKAEVGRAVGITKRDAIEALMKKAL